MQGKSKRTRRASPGRYVRRRTIESRLEKLGVRKALIPTLQLITKEYAETAEQGEPITSAQTKRHLKKFKLEATHFARAVQALPEEVQMGVFVFEDKYYYMWDQEYADMQVRLKRLVSNCTALEKLLSNSRKKPKSVWSRKWIFRIKDKLMQDGWDFAKHDWSVGSSYYRLASVIKVLNEHIPEAVRVSKPHVIVKELFEQK